MRAVVRRIDRLEDQFGAAYGRPRRRLRMMISMAGAKPSLEDATCRRTLCSDGTLMELVEFKQHNAGPDELTEEELDAWLESFPVVEAGPGRRPGRTR
jgi:hypothetical protein